ncbi:MAG: carboxypeptidase-like regulatory domain-containing protein, partial [Spirosomaceae bacterium]|nr:carboxypeptidase-like regulatory domain-containing protein [Spirosomataceae bacterium]
MKHLFFWVMSAVAGGVLLAPSASAQLLASNMRHSPQSNEMKAERPQMLPLKSALADLERTYKVSFIYRSELVDVKIPMPEGRKAGNVETQLQTILESSGLKYERVRDNFYIILSKDQKKDKAIKKLNKVGFQENTANNTANAAIPPIELMSHAAKIGYLTTASVDRTVRGTITDNETGGILAGVSIVVKGTNRGTTTDGQGRYSISVPDGNTTLVFSFIGYASQEVAVSASRSVVDLALMASTASLNEVVVVGYGTQKKTSV